MAALKARPLHLFLLALLALALNGPSAATAQGRGGGGRGAGSTGFPTPMPVPMGRPLPGGQDRATPPANREGGGAETPAPRSERDLPEVTAAPARASKEAREDANHTGNGKDGTPPAESWHQRAEHLLRSQPLKLERDPLGAPVLRGEIILWLPEHQSSAPALALRGFVKLREAWVWDRRLLVLRPPAQLDLERAVAMARELMPEADVDFNHVLLGSGRAAASGSAPSPAPRASIDAADAPIHVGLIDEAPRPTAELAGTLRMGPACPGPEPASGHGTVVASVLVRSLPAAGHAAVLHAADLRCGQGAVDAIATALQGLDQERVPVVNLSAAGPHNRVLAAVVEGFLRRGHLLVAAVGNEGPAAPPLYPAAYPGVIAVTAVDRQGQVLIEAGRGPHVSFAALGVVQADVGDGLRSWRGSSFAAPVVAATLAQRLLRPEARTAAAAVVSLAEETMASQGRRRDEVLGYGVVGPPAAARMAELR
jgi:hypothetical protein